MKYFLTGTFFILTMALAQAQALKQNNQWLEKQLNALTKEKKDGGPAFRFSNCDAKMEMRAGDSDGFNFGMNFGCNWKDIQKVTYQKEKDGYQLQVQVKEEGDEKGKWSFSLNTSDEKLMQEIKRRMEQNIVACRKN